MDINTCINADCFSYMQSLPDECIDCIITSPPYAEQRKQVYSSIKPENYPEWFLNVAKEMKRILKPSGSIILNIKEHTDKGIKSTYVLETILKLSNILRWTETFIWNKTNPFPTGNKKRLKDGFEYCYQFTKTDNYAFYPNNVLVKSTSKYLESEKRRTNKGKHATKNMSGMNMSKRVSTNLVRPSNVISFPIDSTNHKHPATFPISLPDFFIRLLTKENDLVYDPFCGSGTTLLAAKQLSRNFLGTDVCKDYVDLSLNRLS